jgi:hypothetical protein
MIPTMSILKNRWLKLLVQKNQLVWLIDLPVR